MAEIIQGVSYKSIESSSFDSFELIPTDLSGNIFSEVTIGCDTSSGNACDIFLPEISSLNGNWNISINIVRFGNAKVVIRTVNNDFIGSLNAIQLDASKSNVILTPVSSTVWSAILTA
jgi:hypothetical protein